MFGIPLTFFLNDKHGRKLVKKCYHKEKPRFKAFKHECSWGAAKKQSESCPIPPPRIVCAHGYMARLPRG